MTHLIEKPQETVEHLSASYSAIQEMERLLWIEWSGFQGRRQAGEKSLLHKRTPADHCGKDGRVRGPPF